MRNEFDRCDYLLLISTRRLPVFQHNNGYLGSTVDSAEALATLFLAVIHLVNFLV
jgi:hypothetical protein